MKKILLITNLITASLLLVVLLTACPQPSPSPNGSTLNKQDEHEKYEESDEPKISEGICKVCDDVPIEPMLAKEVYSLISNYRNNHYTPFLASGNASTAHGMPLDGRSVWFSLNKLKKFINEIEKMTQNHLDTTQRKCVDKLCDLNLGIRIYYGEYGGVSSKPNLDKFHTVVMVPTYEDKSVPVGANTHVDFDPKNMSVCTPRSIPLDSTLSNFILALTPDVGAMNYGSVIPPPDPVQGPCTGARLMHLTDVKDGYRATLPLCY